MAIEILKKLRFYVLSMAVLVQKARKRQILGKWTIEILKKLKISENLKNSRFLSAEVFQMTLVVSGSFKSLKTSKTRDFCSSEVVQGTLLISDTFESPKTSKTRGFCSSEVLQVTLLVSGHLKARKPQKLEVFALFCSPEVPQQASRLWVQGLNVLQHVHARTCASALGNRIYYQ